MDNCQCMMLCPSEFSFENDCITIQYTDYKNTKHTESVFCRNLALYSPQKGDGGVAFIKGVRAGWCCHNYSWCFPENQHTVRNKNDKTTQIFVKLEQLKSWEVTLWVKRIRLVVVMIWLQLQIWPIISYICNWCHIVTITSLILLVQNVTSWFLRCSTLTNTWMILPFLFFTLIFWKHQLQLWQH